MSHFGFAFALILTGCQSDQVVVDQLQTTLPADGRVHPLVLMHRRSGDALNAGEIAVQAPGIDATHSVSFVQAGRQTVKVLIHAPVSPGKASFSFEWSGKPHPISLDLVPDAQDSFSDGTPDFLRLHSAADRRAFRAWIAGIADKEAALPPHRLPSEIDDCAAFLRFIFREALTRHDAEWFLQQELPPSFLSLPSVSQYRYPNTPLGAALFRVKPGPFLWTDLKNGSFAQFADAQTLMRWNTHLVSPDLRSARAGDLLFFRQLGENSPYHSMVVTGENADWLVYHTGPISNKKGELRRVAVEDLLNYPDARWRPVPGNSNFLGVFRWNVLREAD
ncbi:MAG TPA: DUF1175 family protein [Acidobacteriaceae bacterium]